MGELQVGLLGIGAVVVGAVFLYNKWQERKYRRQAGFSSRHEDVLMRSSGGSGPGTPQAVSGLNRVEPVLGSFDAAQDDADASRQSLSETLDFIVSMEAPGEIAGAALLEATAAALERCSKSVGLEGFDDAQASWEPVDPDRSYARLRSGMQLVDRRGAAEEEELAAFGAGIEEAAATIGVLATAPDPGSAAVRAKELDRFCSDVDIRIAVHIVSELTPFSGTRLVSLAKAAGFELDESDGIFRRRDRVGRVVCVLTNFEPNPFSADGLNSIRTHGVTLELDVPRVPHGALAQFRDAAQLFAEEFNARIVDDNRQPLGPGAFDAIGAQLGAVHASMEARGIVPGGALALRLFS
ncbi:MAG TPA: cell division protein ZipA C-terminal FtsZ-binding domain-containing protein [Burkholderiales bacterium]